MPDRDATALTGTAVNEVAALAEKAATPYREAIHGQEFASRPLYRVKADPEMPKLVDFATLAGFAEFVRTLPGAGSIVNGKGYIIHVASPGEVRALGPLVGEDENLRAIPATATCRSAGMQGFTIGAWYDLETLNIALQTCFVPAHGDIESLRKFCSSVRSTQSVGVDDDGVSQAVEAKRGIAAVQTTRVGNPWLLAPWRTFSEVAQPPAPFILRFTKEESENVQAGLFATGDLSWQVEAIEKVAEHLRALLVGWTVLG